MRSRFEPIALEFTVMAECHGGALGGIHGPATGAYGKAAERLHGFLRPLKNRALKRDQVNANQLN